MRNATVSGATILLLGIPLLAVCSTDADRATAPVGASAQAAAVGGVQAAAVGAAQARSFPVSGSGVHYFSTAAIHSQQPTADGLVQRSTDVIRLSGDLDGYVLYHPTTVIDHASNTLVNTGTQIFSGTIAGSDPVILHDDRFRFEVDLGTGATTGEVFLGRSGDSPQPGGWYECHLVVVGTAVTPAGDNLSDYTGTCTRRGNLR